MDTLRALLAMGVFCLSCYLVFDLFSSGFSWMILVAAIAGFLLVHFIWPENKHHDAWYDAFELIFDLPYQLTSRFLRAIFKGGKDSDIDIGIDL
ncbi:hypothetical protein FLL45_09795 [Aliikangiella marina]|uniref:Uncharacterized protein n=1 Tax=Aliikangiella marina TaxID=1712262 RepID=A0A545TDC6_9GAMM|nr:hypothetical protein [Aliikangiella marina]TQV75219.1 hypothetical protein FLL45_09795 [Aliikangiella marina]